MHNTPHSEVPIQRTSQASSTSSTRNKIPRGALSLEAENLRKFVRQDMEECLRAIVVEGMQDLRQDLREWLSDVRMPKEEARSCTAAPGDADGQGVPSKGVRVDSEHLEPLNPFSRDEIDELPYRLPRDSVGNEASLENSDLRGPQLAEDAARVPGPDEVASASKETIADRSMSNTSALGPLRNQQGENQESQAVWWDWERFNN